MRSERFERRSEGTAGYRWVRRPRGRNPLRLRALSTQRPQPMGSPTTGYGGSLALREHQGTSDAPAVPSVHWAAVRSPASLADGLAFAKPSDAGVRARITGPLTATAAAGLCIRSQEAGYRCETARF